MEMQLHFHRRYQKQYKKLSHSMQVKTDSVIRKFIKNPKAASLKNHALRGEHMGQRAISVTGDLRIIFEEESNYKKVTFIRVGTHNQVY